MSCIKILAIGDIVGPAAAEFLRQKLWKFRGEKNIDFVVANGENVSDNNGIDSNSAYNLLSIGIDVITTGNHVWRKHDIREFLDTSRFITRPANYPAGCPGSGYVIFSVSGYKFIVINVLGQIFMDPLDCPFRTVERILDYEKGNYDFSILDIHAEATSEKYALGYYFDGKINVIFGTHTHVATADEQILQNGTGYITDLGMTGPVNSVLGIKKECIIEKLTTKMPVKFIVGDGKIQMHGAIFELDTDTKKIVSVERIVV